MYKVNQEKWNQFSVNIQLKNIAAEIARATQAALYDKKENKERIDGSYERAISLIDASLADPKTKEKNALYKLRDAIAALYVSDTDPAVSRLLYSQILERSENKDIKPPCG